MRLIATLAWTICAVAVQRQRFGAVDAENLVPRYLVDQSFPLARRAEACPEGRHSCEDIGYGGECCENSRYCYINGNGDPKCCPIGSNCRNLGPCSSDRFFCTVTSTVTAAAADDDGSSATATLSSSTACCPRRCTSTSEYLCASSLGGGCCGYGSECRVGGECVFPLRSTATDTASLTRADEGCTTSQHGCGDGQGCCDDGHRCTQVEGTGYCAPGGQTEVGEPIDDKGSGGLSDGAKVGIGLGTVVGVGLIIGALTWLCMRKRRDRRQTTELGEGSHIQPQDVAAMTDIAAASSRPQLGGYGPMRESLVSAPVTIPFTTGAADQPPGSSPGPYRAVPQHPQQPGDIASAVEIDSNASPYEDGRMSPASASQQPNFFTAAVPINAVEGTFELYSPQAEQGLPFSPSYAPATSADDEHRRNSRL